MAPSPVTSLVLLFVTIFIALTSAGIIPPKWQHNGNNNNNNDIIDSDSRNCFFTPVQCMLQDSKFRTQGLQQDLYTSRKSRTDVMPYFQHLPLSSVQSYGSPLDTNLF